MSEMWASEQEQVERFRAETRPVDRYDFRVRDTWDNGEFNTGATLDLLVDGVVTETHEFFGSSEFADNDGPAHVQAASFAVAWIESMEYTLEERLGPFGLEWEREQEEACGHSFRA